MIEIFHALGTIHISDLINNISGSARVFGYSVFRGVLNRVYGIFGGIWGILGYFVDFFSVILVFHYPPWPTLIFIDGIAKCCHQEGKNRFQLATWGTCSQYLCFFFRNNNYYLA